LKTEKRKMKNLLRTSLFVLFVLLVGGMIPGSNEDIPYEWPKDPLVRKNLKDWQDWKFGILIHWGAYSQWGVVESWSICPEDEGWCQRRGPYSADWYLYKKNYEEIRRTFYPEFFNPEHWARAAKEAGMKYVVFTTKHHDGFCMYDSKFTDYKITDSASAFSKNPRSNVAKEVFNAFRNEGLAIGAYFSKPDWHSPDYWWRYFPAYDRNVNYDPAKYPERWNSFKKFTYNQMDEITTGYGKIDILWLDGGQVRPAGTLTEETKPWLGKRQWIQDIDMPAIAAMVRKNQPGILIVDRTVHGEFENYRTPEQQIPADTPSYPWESCITLCDSWYHTGTGEKYKSAAWAIQTLVKIVAKGGNLLLGIGPDKTGEFASDAYDRLQKIGAWMKVNGDAVYGSRPLAPYQDGDFCFTQSKDGKKKFLFYLVKEGVPLPSSLSLPSSFCENAGKITLLGYPEDIKIVTRNGTKTVTLPLGSFRESPALVFSLRKE
jgi:alpha-L-fucosidase